jgi:hypothetical protein
MYIHHRPERPRLFMDKIREILGPETKKPREN